MKTKKGFSVVEMLVTLALLSIIVVLTLRVGESVTANSRITGLINNFLADFSQAKLEASAENRYMAVTFAADGRSYSILKQTNVSSYTVWTLVKTVTPFTDREFCTAADVSDFAINSTGEVRSLPDQHQLQPDRPDAQILYPQGVGHAQRRDRLQPHHPNIPLWRVES